MSFGNSIIKPGILTLVFSLFLVANAFADSEEPVSPPKIVDEDLILDDDPAPVVPVIQKTPAAEAAAKAPADSGSAKKALPDTLKTAKKPDSLKKTVDEELVLEGGEEDLLSGQLKKASVAPSAAGDSAPAKAQLPGDSSSRSTAADSVAGDSRPNMKPNGKQDPATPAQAAGAAVPPPVTAIENARSINFAANLKQYRSPKLAMLMSLVLPGSGQVYAKSNWWAAGFLAVEAAVVATGVVYSSKSRTQKDKAHAFADDNYSVQKFSDYADDLKKNLSGIGLRGDTIYQSLFFDSSDVDFINAGQSPQNRSDEFYSYMESKTSIFIRGWKDVTPDFNETGFDLGSDSTYRLYSQSPDSSYLVYKGSQKSDYAFGFSSFQQTYKGMMDESRKLANNSRTAFLSLLINHLASAVMAGIEAKNHNDAMLGRETFLRRIELRAQAFNTGSETVSGYALGVHF